MEILMDILNAAVYSILAIVLMLGGNFLIDLAIPCHFPTEIKKGNKAVGFLSAGSFVAIGILLRAAIMSPASSSVIYEETLVSGIVSSIVYFAVGIVFSIIGYFVLNAFHKQYNLNEEIGNGNTAAGIVVGGMFIGLAIAISGVIF
ncbi:MAG: DUF350 domain-containing protein [Firmicutes bacterium]|nr:DUF350 domain-containing protein [Bacillota bacterium]